MKTFDSYWHALVGGRGLGGRCDFDDDMPVQAVFTGRFSCAP